MCKGNLRVEIPGEVGDGREGRAVGSLEGKRREREDDGRGEPKRRGFGVTGNSEIASRRNPSVKK